MKKTATNSYPIHSLIAERWSPRAFSNQPVEEATIGSLLEAARWAPSCFNEQPWRFLVASQEDRVGFERLASCLVEGNAWAKKAPVLILSVARKTFARNGKPNRHAGHDVGLAVGNLITQAQALGLSTHQMAGFDVEKAHSTLGIPEDCEPMAMIAVGYPGDANALSDELKERELAPRSRIDLQDISYSAEWGTPLAQK